MGFGIGEIVLIGFGVLLIFGGKKLPALGKAMGESINQFKKGMKEDDNSAQKIEKKD
ncbi:MAG: twin-arginine translocase TatA/TatE family subunit [Bacteriovoracaceae bacterium]|nr:twin-arginine translocase TatA/TatE family subunit [Bacteriovoracaceae bacterium]